METEKDIKVVVAVPSSDASGRNVMTAKAIGSTIIDARDLVVDFIVRRSCDIASNRTWLVNEALEAGGTHILFVDCDMLFPADTIRRLLAHKKEIVGVEYNARKFPLKGVQEPLTERSDTEIYKAKFAGTGLMLINLSIFKDPKFGIDDKGNTCQWFSFGRDSQGNLALGEDAWFCFVARDAGYDTWIDPTLKIYHLGEYGY